MLVRYKRISILGVITSIVFFMEETSHLIIMKWQIFPQIFLAFCNLLHLNDVEYLFWLPYFFVVFDIYCSSIQICMTCLENCLHSSRRGSWSADLMSCNHNLNCASCHRRLFPDQGWDPRPFPEAWLISRWKSLCSITYNLRLARSYECSSYIKVSLISLKSEVCVWAISQSQIVLNQYQIRNRSWNVFKSYHNHIKVLSMYQIHIHANNSF